MQGGMEDLIASGIFLIVMLGVLGVTLIIWAVICYVLMTCFQRIPEQFRTQDPNMVWLLMIPCFNVIWNFFVWPKLSESYEAYFRSVGNTEVGDCNASLNNVYCILAAVSAGLSVIQAIPIIGLIGMLNCLLGPALFVVLIINIVKAVELKNMIPDAPAEAAA